VCWLKLGPVISVELKKHLLCHSHLTAIVSGGPGLAGARMSPFWSLLEQRMMEVVVSTGAIRRAKLQSNYCHQQTKTPKTVYCMREFSLVL